MDRAASDRPAFRRATALVLLLLVALVPATGARGQLLRIIDDPENEAGAAFGWALADVGGGFAVGAPGASVSGSAGAGRVQIFAANGALRRTLEASRAVPGAGLGTALVADATLLYAGAPGDQPIGVSGLGAVYVFELTSGALVRVIGSPAPDSSTTPVGGTVSDGPFFQSTGPRPVAQGFGRALAVTGERIVVGAPESIVRDLAGAGAVYIYRTDGALERTLRDPSPEANAFFGTSVAVVGDVLFVGAPGATEAGLAGAGVVQVFDASTGAFRRTLSPPISRAAAEFGTVVGRVGGALFVSAPGDHAFGSDAAGAVYLFEAGVAFDRVITPPTTEPDMDFGRAVVAVGGDLVVGADGAGGDASGAAFRIDPTTSSLVTRFTPTARPGGRFGFALAAAGPVIAIGEPATDDADAVGRVYLFGPPTETSPGSTRPMDPGATAPPAGAAARCPLGATTASIDCRLAVLRATVRDEGLTGVTGPLRRAGRNVRRADGARGTRRMRALGRAARGLGLAASRLGSGHGSAAIVAEMNTVRGDLARLVEAGGR